MPPSCNPCQRLSNGGHARLREEVFTMLHLGTLVTVTEEGLNAGS
jgi:hypothetical protein